jgi:predicted MPP superfamily phosphohydrolase
VSLPAIVIFSLVLALFAACNVAAVRVLTRLHPRRRRIVYALVIVCNVLWPLLPVLNARTPLSRIARAVFGPPWFAWLCFVLLYSLFMLLVWIARIPRRAASRVFMWVTIIAAIVGGWQALVSLRVERVSIALHDLPPPLDGTRIAVLADLHTGLFTRRARLRQFFATANALRPDVVLLAGDLVDDDPVYLPKLLDGLRPLDPSVPLVAVLGNHEMYGAPEEFIARMRPTRVKLLVNEGASVRGLWIAGISDYAARIPSLKPDMAAALRARPADAFPILVSHQPRSFDEARQRNIPLTICAHTHGGQCGFRPLHWSLAGLFLRYHMGLYRAGGSQLYVNTGTGFWVLPFRLGMTPEITLITLKRDRGAGQNAP